MATTPATHDAVRHSTEQTHVREAREAWEAFVASVKSSMKFSAASGGPAFPDDPKILQKMLAQMMQVGWTMEGALASVHWPTFDPARSLKTDERAHELAERMIREGHPELAWDICQNAYRFACEYHRRPDGIDLSLYYRCEANAVLAVLRKHYEAETAH
jgi:hypothetical protein